MSDDIQSLIIAAILLAALLYLASRVRGKKSCERGGCGCVSKKPFKGK